MAGKKGGGKSDVSENALFLSTYLELYFGGTWFETILESHKFFFNLQIWATNLLKWKCSNTELINREKFEFSFPKIPDIGMTCH